MALLKVPARGIPSSGTLESCGVTAAHQTTAPGVTVDFGPLLPVHSPSALHLVPHKVCIQPSLLQGVLVPSLCFFPGKVLWDGNRSAGAVL